MAKKRKSIIVTVGDEALGDIHQLASRLGAKGMNVERVLPMTGVITGTSAQSKIAGLRQVDGVTSVEEELAAELPPPGSTAE